jgi:hypothetical protein
MAMHCAARPDTVARQRMTTGAWLELRYSRECGTSWARTWGTRIGDRIELTVRDRGREVRAAEIEDAADADSFVYTPMAVTRPGTVVHACLRPETGGREECLDGRVD